MGVAPGLALACGLAAVGASVLGSPHPASVAAVAGLGLGGAALLAFGRRWPEASAGMAALGLAPGLVAALHRGDLAGGVALAACLLLIGLRRGVLPVAVPAVLLGLGLAEGIRAVAATGTLAIAAASVAPLVLAGLGAAGAASLPGRPRVLGGALLVGALVAGVGRLAPPRGGVADTAARAALGLPISAPAGLAEELAVIARRPMDHARAARLATEHGVDLPLSAGWRPHGAALAAADRIEAARWLELRGRGGEGRRLLSAGRADPEVAWWWVLSRRAEGLPDPDSLDLQPPPGVHHLPGKLSLRQTLLTNTTRSWVVHVDAPCALSLVAWGEAWQGAPEVGVQVDGGAPVVHALPETFERLQVEKLTEGPHRIRLRFDNDASGPGGDRNVHLIGFRCVTP